MFVAGSYVVMSEPAYVVYAIWRDGKIVFSASDKKGAYERGSIGNSAADFE